LEHRVLEAAAAAFDADYYSCCI